MTTLSFTGTRHGGDVWVRPPEPIAQSEAGRKSPRRIKEQGSPEETKPVRSKELCSFLDKICAHRKSNPDFMLRTERNV
jgi:hypothetical protein